MKATACWIRAIFNCSIISMVSSVSQLLFHRWISLCSAASCLSSVPIERFVSFKSKSCPNSSRFTRYLLNKCSLQSPQSIWSFSCINVIDLLFEPFSLSLSLSVQINLMPLLSAKWFTTIKFSVILCATKNWFRTVWRRRRRRGLAS